MLTVYKYPLLLLDTQTVLMPRGAEILSAQEQQGQLGQQGGLFLWARVDPSATQRVRVIAICGTGRPAPLGVFIGTVQMADGALVWHVFDTGEPE